MILLQTIFSVLSIMSLALLVLLLIILFPPAIWNGTWTDKTKTIPVRRAMLIALILAVALVFVTLL